MYEQNSPDTLANDYRSFTSVQQIADYRHSTTHPANMADVESAIFTICFALAIAFAIRKTLRSQEFKRQQAAFKRLPVVARAAFVSLMVAVIAYGGAKPGTNTLEKIARPLAVLMNSGEQLDSISDTVSFTENQLLAGFALTAVVTNETFDLSAPSNAVVHSNWLKRGAAEDGFWVPVGTFLLGTNRVEFVYVSSSGTLSFNRPKSSPNARLMPDGSSIAFLAPLQTVLGIPPESRWEAITNYELRITNSLFWYDVTDSGSSRFTWQNALLGRETNAPVSFQAELFPSGDFVFKYDFSAITNHKSQITNFVVGAQNNGGGEIALIATSTHICTDTNHLCASLYSLDGTNVLTTPLCSVITNSPKFSLRWKNIGNLGLAAADPDGDGISSADEIFIYHTDPDHADTDGDGLSDAVEIASGTGTNGTSPLDPDSDDDGVPDGLTESEWLLHPLFGGANAPNLMLSVATSFDGPPPAALNVAGLTLPVHNGATWALRLEPGVSYPFRLANATDRAIQFVAWDPRNAAGRTLSKTLETQRLAQGRSASTDAFVVDDPDGIFDHGAISGKGDFGFVRIAVDPDTCQTGSICVHGSTPTEFAVSVHPDFALDRMEWNAAGGTLSFSTSKGTAFLSLDSGESFASATATISPANSLFGSVSVEMSVHLHESAGTYCNACGYVHSGDPDCGHEPDCSALLSLEGDCTCPPRFIRVNSDDDDLDGSEDRNHTTLAEGENDLFPLNLSDLESCAHCSCGEGIASLKIIGHSSGLRLRRNGDIIGNGAEVTSTNSFSIEATQPSSLIGSHQITYDIYSGSETGPRRITRHFTAANTQIKPDYDDSGSVDVDDAWVKKNGFAGEIWLLPRRQEPYLIHLQNECPDDAVLSLSLSGNGDIPALRCITNASAILTPLSGSVTGPPLAVKNDTTSVWLDASCTTIATTLIYTIAPSNGVPFVYDSQTIQIIDTSLPERWIAQGDSTEYSFADVMTDIYWDLYDADYNLVDTGYGGSFEVGSGLASGDYEVWASAGDIATTYIVTAYYPKCMNAIDTAIVYSITVDLEELSFMNNHTLVSDDSTTTNEAAHWQDPNRDGDPSDGRCYPLCFTRDTKMTVSGKWYLQPSNSGIALKIKGDGPGNLDFPATTASISGTEVTITTVECENAFADEIDFMDPMTINWQFSFDDGTTWYDAGTSTNQTYVTLGNPSTDVILFHTLVHVGCKNGDGESDTDDAVGAIWSDFTDRIVKRVDGETLYYYSNAVPTLSSVDVPGLLATADGQCTAWAGFFAGVLLAQGIDASVIALTPGDIALWNSNDEGNPVITNVVHHFFNGGLLVKNWSFLNANWSEYDTNHNCVSDDIEAMYPDFQFGIYLEDLHKFDTINYAFLMPYTDFFSLGSYEGQGNIVTSGTGIKGQGDIVPIVQMFNCHYIVTRDYNPNLVFPPQYYTVYDPSYGTKYEGTDAIEQWTASSIDGFYEIDDDATTLTNQMVWVAPNDSNTMIKVNPDVVEIHAFFD